ncbi:MULTISPECIES: zinc-binding alcohol dehydrogenase family protein [unclassified Acidocella]|uniref:zinc-binding alcohol dehydrogenase family protein n=1 Tax=unclassified Acidocella TaxID=2648610 RepID=UPI00028DB1AA|nr:MULTISPECIES: zinc-binding alcohol dehydrogenase family protein [unclassified Acidocella]EKN01350.1 alcohol dehydrogenase GroES domain-containing protein [Acidocella sp. MX-AZ02]WBO60864.1 zinc-binding alcohol dehydrogenase family protein [Acidocella sp. MX-AZ03]
MNDKTFLMQRGVCVEPHRFELWPSPLPLSAPAGWALVDIAAMGVCGTDYHIFEGKHPYLEYPRVIGHELSGRLVEGCGGMAKGTLVVVNPYLACGECRACRNNKPNCCTRIEVLGVHRDGGLCARIAVPQGNLYPADGLTETQAAMVEFLAIGAHAVARAGDIFGSRTLITGAGPIGLGAALFARLAGADVHLLDISAKRLQKVGETFGFTHLHHGATHLLQGERADGFDVIFDATGNAQAIEAGFAFLAHGGTYVLISVVKDRISFNDPEFHKREARLIGSRNALKEDFMRVIAAIRAGQIDTSALLSEELHINELAARLPLLAKDREDLIKAIVYP